MKGLTKFIPSLEFISNKLNEATVDTRYKPTDYQNLKEILKTYDKHEKKNGGFSGAKVYFLYKKEHVTVLKYFNNNYIHNTGHRIIREIYSYIKINLLFHDKKNIDKSNIDFAKLLQHGKIGNSGYYFLMTKLHGNSLYETITSYKNEDTSKNHDKFIWYKKTNIIETIKYILKAYKELCNIFGENFIHNDLHSKNILVETNNSKNPLNVFVTKISIIDFDLIDSNIFEDELNIELPREDYLTKNRVYYDKMSYMKVLKPLVENCYNYRKNNNQFKVSSKKLFNYSNSILNQSNYFDIRFLYLIFVILIELNRKLFVNLVKDIENNDTQPVLLKSSQSIIDQQKIPINLNNIYDKIMKQVKPRNGKNLKTEFTSNNRTKRNISEKKINKKRSITKKKRVS
jgi:hypothetical protein